MANPTLTPFPTPPLPEQDEVTFNRNAANSLLAQANFVGEANTVVTWMGQQVDTVAAAKKAAADSAAAAAQSANDASTQGAAQVKLATDQATAAKGYADNAKTYRDSAQVIAASLGSQAALPAFTGHAGDFLGVNADEKTVDFFPGMQTGFQEFTSSGVFSKPAKAKWIIVEAVGAGAGGAWAALNTNTSGQSIAQGGDGGSYNFKIFRASEVPSSVAVVPGTGGAGGVSGNTAGKAGQDSTFGSLLTAKGGQATTGNPIYIYAALPDHSWLGGLGGRPQINSQGSNGGVTSGSSSIKGGAGGAAVYSQSSTMYASNPGTSVDAGNGGTVNTSTSQASGDGVFPGGGGAATSGGTAGGKGAMGRVRIWWM